MSEIASAPSGAGSVPGARTTAPPLPDDATRDPGASGPAPEATAKSRRARLARRGRADLIAIAALSTLVAAAPWLTDAPYVVQVVLNTAIFVALGAGWNLIGGYAGQVSFGHAAFFGIGAYTTAITLLRIHGAAGATESGGLSAGTLAGMVLSLPLAGLAAAVFALAIGLPTLRLRGPFFSIATIGVGEAVRLVALYADPITGGGHGLNLPLELGDVRLLSYYLAGLWMLVVLVAAWWIERSKFGLALASIRMDEDAALTLGVDTAAYKVRAFVLSAFVVGVAGGIFATTQFNVGPNSVFAFSLSVAMILMAVVGGIGTLWGPVIGAAIYVLLREEVIAYRPSDHLFIFGFLLIAVILFEPGGIAGGVRRLRRGLRR